MNIFVFRHCDGGVINSREEAERFLHCTHITGELEIRVSEGKGQKVLSLGALRSSPGPRKRFKIVIVISRLNRG